MAAGTGTATIDFGADPTAEGEFVIADANVTAASFVEAYVQHNDSHADNDVEAHKAFGAFARFICAPASGQFTLAVLMLHGMVTGNFQIRYAWST